MTARMTVSRYRCLSIPHRTLYATQSMMYLPIPEPEQLSVGHLPETLAQQLLDFSFAARNLDAHMISNLCRFLGEPEDLVGPGETLLTVFPDGLYACALGCAALVD
jgi:hypothetical protein